MSVDNKPPVHPGGIYGGRKPPRAYGAKSGHRTWEQLVQPDRLPKEDPGLPETIPFTYPVHANAYFGTTRRERRDAGRAEREDLSVTLVTEDLPSELLINRRARRRADDRFRARRQRKGQRVFAARQRKHRKGTEALIAQQAVLLAGPGGQIPKVHGRRNPRPAVDQVTVTVSATMYRNVANALSMRYRDDLAAQGVL